jgi:hypothetical protein
MEFDFAGSEYIVIPAVLASIGLMVAVSLMTKPSAREKWAPFFEDDAVEAGGEV